jgi:glycerophosphoryl diester phosphodiesterase
MARRRFPFLDHEGPIPFAHRGGGKERPENTWAAFSHARDLGFRYLETDVHVTTDGVVAVIHDPVLDRVSDRTGSVAELPWAEVSAARLDGEQQVPRLDELLATWPEARWNIDAKHDAVVEPLIDVLKRAGAIDRVCVSSFFDHRIKRVQQLAGPALCTSAGRKGTAAVRAASYLGPAGAALGATPIGWGTTAAVQVPTRFGRIPVTDTRFIGFAHARGLQVHVWTIDDEATMGELLDLGVDGLMTDRPSVLKQTLERRGQWV